MNAIEIKELSKYYKDCKAVNNLSLEIKEGELFALLGVNGAGKTTLIKMLTGLLAPTSGDAFIFGKSIKQEINAIKEITNVSPQETAVAMNLTVKENLFFMGGIYGFQKEELAKAVDEVKEALELDEVINKKAKTLSGGWQRRLSIALALISHPKILFLDEPTLGLDVLARRELWKVILSLKGKTTIILTTHYLEEVEALSDCVGIMVKGKLKALGTVDELKDASRTNTLEDAFVYFASEVK